MGPYLDQVISQHALLSGVVMSWRLPISSGKANNSTMMGIKNEPIMAIAKVSDSKALPRIRVVLLLDRHCFLLGYFMISPLMRKCTNIYILLHCGIMSMGPIV